MDKLRDKAEGVADHVAECKLELIGAKFHDEAEARNYKDTHVDLSMEMWILHNKSRDAATPVTARQRFASFCLLSRRIGRFSPEIHRVPTTRSCRFGGCFLASSFGLVVELQLPCSK